MNKLVMMMIVACATMMGAKAYTLVEPDPSAASVTAMWLTEDDILGIQSNPDVLDILGMSDSCYEVVIGDYDRYYNFNSKKIANFPIGEHVCTYPFVKYATINTWADAFEKYSYGKVYICHKGDNGVDAETTIRFLEIGHFYKDADDVWHWAGANGINGGIVGTSAPVVEDDDDETIVDDSEPETKCPVLRLLKKISKR